MGVVSFSKVLQLIGLSQSSQLAASDHWQLWLASEHTAFGEHALRILHFDSRATWDVLSDAVVKACRPVTEGQLHVIVQNSAPIARQLERVKNECRAVTARTVTQLLERSVARMLGATRIEPDPELDRLFVEPDVKLGEVGQPTKAMQALSQWLTGTGDTGPRVAALVAEAGVGKTTVATQLFRRLLASNLRDHFPILVQSDQWAKLSDRASLSLWDIWREALDALYGSTINRDDFDTCVENGSLLPIFDGFDELCTRLGSHFSATDTLDQLLDLVSETDGRILLTTRDGFWSDGISIDRRRGLDHFRLLPFNRQQTAKYFENRFRIASDAPKRAIAGRVLSR